jgi:hypothetical protein
MSAGDKRSPFGNDGPAHGRRRALAAGARGLLGGLAAAAARGTAAQGQPSAGATPAPGDVGRKFNADGTVRPFAGNTFIGRIPQQGARFAVFDTLLDAYREVPASRFARKLTMLPPSSYHVTLFGGVNDADRNTPKWASPAPHDTPIDKLDALYLDRLRRAARPARRGFEFACGAPPEPGADGTLHIPLRPADAATQSRLRALRDELSALTGIRRPDHDRYEYHVTLGYLYGFLDESEASEMRKATASWMQRLERLGTPILIPSFHFCTFRDMFAFEEKWEV